MEGGKEKMEKEIPGNITRNKKPHSSRV